MANKDGKCNDPKCPVTKNNGGHTSGVTTKKPDAKCSGGKK